MYNQTHWGNLPQMVDYALDASHYSRAIHSLVDAGDVSQASAFLGASIMTDPTREYEEIDAYQEGIKLMSQLTPSSINGPDFSGSIKERKSNTWNEYTN